MNDKINKTMIVIRYGLIFMA